MRQITFDYGKAIRQAEEVDRIAQDMRQIASRQMDTAAENLRVTWKGKAARQFLANLDRDRFAVMDRARELEELGKQIRSTAQIIREAETQAGMVSRRSTE